MKRTIVILSAIAALAAAYAAPLPNGVDAKIVSTREENGKVVAATVAAPVVLTTKYGNFTAEADTEICFYESGALKSFYADGIVEAALPQGTLPLTSTTTKSAFQPHPIVLDEDGNLAAAYLPDLRSEIIVTTQAGTLSLRPRSVIEFFPDGTISRTEMRGTQTIAAGGKQIKLYSNSAVAFYDDGSIKAFVPADAAEWNGFAAQRGKPVTLSQSGSVLALTPAQKTFTELGELVFYFVNGKPLVFSDGGGIAEMTLDCADKDFQYGGVRVLCKTAVQTVQDKNPQLLFRPASFAQPSPSKALTFAFYDDGTLRSLEAAATRGEFVFSCNESDFAAASAIYLHPNGAISCVHYASPLVVTDEDSIRARHWFEFRRDYFAADGTCYARLGTEVTKSEKGGAFDTAKKVLFLPDGARRVYDGDFSDEAVIAAYGGQ